MNKTTASLPLLALALAASANAQYSVTTTASPATFTGACPAEITFTASIEADTGGAIVYQWQRSDGAKAPEEKATLVKGKNVFTTSWNLGDARLLPDYSGWQSLRILSPTVVESNAAKFTIRCTTAPTGRGPIPEQFPPFDIRVDQSIRPAVAQLPTVDGLPRPVASVIGPSGTQTDFAENELLVMPANDSILRDFLARTSGEILATESMGEVKGLNSIYLVRVHPGGANASRLNSDLRSLGAVGTGGLTVSSDAALRLLAAAAREAASQGTPVAINLVTRQFDFARRTTTEAPAGPSPWNSNAFTWPYITRRATVPESNQNIGVGDAWRLLQLGSLLGNRTGVAVLDAGFQRMPDMSFELWRSPLRDDERAASRFPCSGGAPCPFHGTDVISALAAIPDNGIGTAGPGGPVVDVLAIERGAPDTFFGVISSIINTVRALGSGRRIVNMSFGADIDTVLSLLFRPIVDPVFALTRVGGTLVFAAAGNSGIDVDAPGPFGEAAYSFPCESPGVLCVGGLAWDSRMPHPNSNFGSGLGIQSDSVDIFAPFTVWVGAAPGDPPDVPKLQNGTSVASPFAAGVATLIAAANPSMSTGRIERLLLAGANRPSTPGDAPLWVNAFLPVAIAAGSAPPDDFPPNIQIMAPVSGTAVDSGRPVSFIAQASDFEGRPNIRWTFPDGSIALGPNATYAFREPGVYTISASATDSAGHVTTARTEVLVVNPRPEPQISYPAEGQRLLAGRSLNLAGFATDRNEGPGPGAGLLPPSALSWTDDRGDFTASGDAPSVVFRTAGAHTLTLTAVDSSGQTASVTRTIVVVTAAGDESAYVRAIAPRPGTTFTGDPETLAIRLQGETNLPLSTTTFVWYADFVDGSGVTHHRVAGSGLDLIWRPGSMPLPRGAFVPVTLRLVGTDASSGVTREHAVPIVVGFPPG